MFLIYGWNVFGFSDNCERCMERIHWVAIEWHGKVLQVHGETCTALESCLS